MTNFANYQGQADYGTDFTRRKIIDLNEYRFADPVTQIFNGNVARVIVTEGKYGMQWGVTLANEQSKQKATVYISAESTSILAQQLLLITTGGLISNEKDVTTEQGTTFTVVDNIKGPVNVVLVYIGQSQRDTPIYNALSFFYADGFSIEEKQRKAVQHEDIMKSFNVAKSIQQNQGQVQKNSTTQNNQKHYANTPSQAQMNAQMNAYKQMSQPAQTQSPYAMPPQPQPSSLPPLNQPIGRNNGQTEDDIPF